MTLQVATPSFVTVNGHRLAYDEVSPPNPRGTILLLTGLAAKRLGWYKQMPVFGQFYRTIAIDHRDVGDSDETPVPYTIADQADDAAVLLGALGVSRAYVIGISMGGFIALRLTIQRPDLVEKLVLTSTSAGGATHVNPSQEILAMLVQPREGVEIGELAKRTYARIMAPGYCESHPDDWERVAENARYRPQSVEAYGRQLQACLGHDVASRLGEIHVPTLVIHGDHDPLVPYPNGQYLAAHISGARMITYFDVGHIPIVERADEYNRQVLAFLAE
ncbi:MAG TPA: alpha/beta fold hydrolase [Ktedonobacterales bacterium]|nr:alpha/beta fold hydrolase [Ktedonobacterales bacterium]